MGQEEKKEWLTRYLGCRREIERDCRAIRRWRQLAEGAAPQMDSSAGGKSPRRESQLEKAVCELMEIREELPNKVGKLPKLRREIAEVIGVLPDKRLQLVLQYRYFHGLSFAALGKKVGYCEYYVSVLHKNALELLSLSEEKQLRMA